MPKKKNRKKKRTITAEQKGARAMLPICVRAVILSYAFFVIGTGLLAWTVLQKETTPTNALQTVFMFVITGLSFLICGCLSARKNAFPVLPICFFSGFALLVLIVLTLLLAAKGNVSVFLCAPIGMGIIFPILGGIAGKRL